MLRPHQKTKRSFFVDDRDHECNTVSRTLGLTHAITSSRFSLHTGCFCSCAFFPEKECEKCPPWQISNFHQSRSGGPSMRASDNFGFCDKFLHRFFVAARKVFFSFASMRSFALGQWKAILRVLVLSICAAVQGL